MFDIGPLEIAKDRGHGAINAGLRFPVSASSAYAPVTSFTRLKKARLRSVLMPQFTGTL